MNKIILVGKLNEVTKEISEYLSETYHVQLCSANPEVLKGMLRLTEPDIVIVSLLEISLAAKDIVDLLAAQFKPAPVIIIGGKEDASKMADRGLLADGWITFLYRPVKAEQIAVCVSKILNPYGGVKKEKVKERKEEKKTILVVDDSPMFLRSIRAVLIKKYDVMFATSGPLAIASIAKKKPDLILLDYVMPVCDGAQTMKMLKSEKETKDIPVIFLTANAKRDSVMKVIDLQPDDYLLKPPSEERLFDAIEHVLMRKEKKLSKKDETKGGVDAERDGSHEKQ